MSQTDLDRDPLEVLFSQFLEQNRGGNAVAIEQFAAAHPELAEEIEDLFPTLMALEQAGARLKETVNKRNKVPASDDSLHLGEYRLLREIGAGGMGVVYEALQESVQRRVAVKVLPREYFNDSERRQRFLQEARTVARLSYRNIVPVLDFGESSGRCYFTMQLIEGVGLDWVILRLRESRQPLTSSEVKTHFATQGHPLTTPEDIDEMDDDSLACEFNELARQSSKKPRVQEKWGLRADSWKQFARIGIQAAKALEHAHQKGILHRDIKPGNLLLDEAGTVWITDFGLAKSEKEFALTNPNDLVGTLRYIAPERFEGRLDQRSDVYSLGLTLLELCLQQQAFEQAGRSELVRSILDGKILAPRKINPQLPQGLEQILLRATARKPEHRYPSAAALIEDLRAFVRGNQRISQLRKPVYPIELPAWWKWSRVAAVLLAVCLLQGILLGWMWSRGPAILAPETPVLLDAQLATRLGALDSMYEQTLRRDLNADLDSPIALERLPAYSPQRTSIENLLVLYSQTRQESMLYRMDDLSQQIQLRLDRLEQLRPKS